jgi:capsular polysaccharide biosynthesis protein/cellulose biosynthesis protein BcsQ
VGAALGIAAGLTLVAVTPKSYTSTATLFVGLPVSTDSSVAYNLDLFSQQRALTYSNLAQSRDVAVKVRDDLGLAITPEELSAKVSAAVVPKTVLMKISATDSSPQKASDIANMFATDFTEYVARMETPKGSDQPSSVVTVVQKAELPTSPTSPNTAFNILIGLFVGLVLGFFAKWVTRILDRRVRTSQQVAESTGAPVLGVLPKDAARGNRMLHLATDATSAYAEAVRKLRSNLLYTDVDAPPKAIAFISPTSTMSTTATATNLAVVLDGTGRHVGLIDADMRESRLARYIGSDVAEARAVGGKRRRSHSAGPSRQREVSGRLNPWSGADQPEQHRGLSSVLTGDAALVDATVRVPDTGIDVLLAGPSSNTAGEMLASDALAKLFAELRNSYDFVLCDTPGLLTATDAAEVGRACDCVVLVAARGKTRLRGLAETAETLRSLGANVIGAVLTEAR